MFASSMLAFITAHPSIIICPRTCFRAIPASPASQSHVKDASAACCAVWLEPAVRCTISCIARAHAVASHHPCTATSAPGLCPSRPPRNSPSTPDPQSWCRCGRGPGVMYDFGKQYPPCHRRNKIVPNAFSVPVPTHPTVRKTAKGKRTTSSESAVNTSVTALIVSSRTSIHRREHCNTPSESRHDVAQPRCYL